MKIELISHCYAVDLPQYARHLVYQLSSLHLYPPDGHEVSAVICTSKDDYETLAVVEWFQENPKLDVEAMVLEKSELARRAIGRNRAALLTEADFVWFADCDQAYRDNVLGKVCDMEWADGVVMYYPTVIHIHKDHRTGDEYAQQVTDIGLYDINKADFIPKRYRKAVGGVQIVKGEFAREHGYLNHSDKWQRPADRRPFSKNCFDDVVYRKWANKLGEIRGTDLEGMYRLRHSLASRRI